MLVGKRPGPPIMRRTRSMSGGMAVDMQEATTEAISNNLEAHHEEAMPLPNSLHSHQHQHQHHEEDGIKDDPHADVVMGTQAEQTKYVFGTKGYELYDERLVGTDTVMFPSPTTTTTTTDNHRSQNQTNNVNPAHAHLIPTPHFLRTCGLCRCHLATGRDIYMYRGDTAFCSLECREKQMKQDQRKEKWKVASNSSKQDHRVSVSPPTATANASTKAQTAAAST